MPPDGPYIAHLVSHTHWDREWYRTFQRFRMRLVEVTDALLGLLESEPDETPIGDLPVRDGAVRMDVSVRRIVMVRLEG